jgi:dephospho-CoA kinase
MKPTARFVVALTGGIAAGKSAVSARFAALGVDVYDADLAARTVVAPGSAGLAAIVERFGAAMLDSSGALDRRTLRAVVFNDAAARRDLEAITHERIRAQLLDELAGGRSAYALLVIPLLVESPHYTWVDRVLVVTAPLALRVERLIARDAVSAEQAHAAIALQASDEARLKLAHEVIVNDGALDRLDHAVAKLDRGYRVAAAAASA